MGRWTIPAIDCPLFVAAPKAPKHHVPCPFESVQLPEDTPPQEARAMHVRQGHHRRLLDSGWSTVEGITSGLVRSTPESMMPIRTAGFPNTFLLPQANHICGVQVRLLRIGRVIGLSGLVQDRAGIWFTCLHIPVHHYQVANIVHVLLWRGCTIHRFTEVKEGPRRA